MNNFKLEVHFNFALFVLLDENKEAEIGIARM